MLLPASMRDQADPLLSSPLEKKLDPPPKKPPLGDLPMYARPLGKVYTQRDGKKSFTPNMSTIPISADDALMRRRDVADGVKLYDYNTQGRMADYINEQCELNKKAIQGYFNGFRYNSVGRDDLADAMLGLAVSGGGGCVCASSNAVSNIGAASMNETQRKTVLTVPAGVLGVHDSAIFTYR